MYFTDCPVISGIISNDLGTLYINESVIATGCTITTPKLVFQGHVTVNSPLNMAFTGDEGASVTINATYKLQSALTINSFDVAFFKVAQIDKLTLLVTHMSTKRNL
jgi:hypothetical protein